MRLIYSQTSEDMRLFHQQTMDLMREFSATPNPINYHILYEYVLGDNSALKEAVNKIRHKKEKWTDITGIRFTEQYFKENEREIISCEQNFIKNINHLSHKIHEHMDSHFELADDLDKNPNKASVIAMLLKKANRNISQDIRMSSQHIQATKSKLIKHKQQSLTDMVTGLHNEHHLREFLPYIIKRNRSMGKTLVLALMDIDQFSAYNDQHGHQVADALLQAYADVLRSLGEGTHAWRISADEFLLTIVVNNPNEIKELLGNIYQKISSLKMNSLTTKDEIKQQPVTMVVDLVHHNFETTLNRLTKLLKENHNQSKLIFSDDI